MIRCNDPELVKDTDKKRKKACELSYEAPRIVKSWRLIVRAVFVS